MKLQSPTIPAGLATMPLFQTQQSRAETLLLDLADFIYVHTSLKPISKVLFLLSRLLLVCRYSETLPSGPASVVRAYSLLKKRFGLEFDDYKFEQVVSESAEHLPRILEAIRDVCSLTNGTDSLGLAFNTLVRGKFEAGEGLGTHLTPEEVVRPMVRMALAVLGNNSCLTEGSRYLFGDISGGTGRFVHALLLELAQRGISAQDSSRRTYVFDQSRLSIDLGRINFLLQGLAGAHFELTSDSILDERVHALRGRFALLATNPPFGTGKYRWSMPLDKALDRNLLFALGLRGIGDKIDPAEIFTIMNLELLAPGGVLAIVLPDGIVSSDRFRDLLLNYERHAGAKLGIEAVISLPVATFSLGGTVAKTSFMIIKKLGPGDRSAGIFAGTVHHVGFLKKGNVRVADSAGNDLDLLADEFLAGKGRGRIDWRQQASLSAALIEHQQAKSEAPREVVPLESVADLAREFIAANRSDAALHISILDVDETGFIDIWKSRNNEPITKSLRCQPNDILLSCLNPKIWRVSVVPNLPGIEWTCSPEFAVIRPKNPEGAWNLFLKFATGFVKSQVIALAKGTSSSRQRVPKTALLSIKVPRNGDKAAAAKELRSVRQQIYALRLRELPLLIRG